MIVALTGVIVFGLLLAVNWRFCSSVVYPGVAFAGIWLLEFTTQVFAQSVLYPISWSALAVFVIGALSFTAGAALTYLGAARQDKPTAPVTVQPEPGDAVILWVFVAFLVTGLPIYIDRLRQLTSADLFSPMFFFQVRYGLIEQAATLNRAPLVDNLVVLSSIFALSGYALTDGGRRQRIATWCLVGLALIYNLFAAAKAGPIALVIALFSMHVLLRGQLRASNLILSIVIILFLFSVVTVGRLGVIGQPLTLSQSLMSTWEIFLSYFSGAPVGFSIYLDNPQWVPAVWSPWRFFERTANYFGNFFNVPESHAQYVYVGPGLWFNTYTAYFSYYPPYGIGGVVGFMFAIGIVCSWIYRRALSLGLVWLVLYGILFEGILMTIFGEHFMLSLNFILKLIVVVLLISGLRKKRWHRGKGSVGMPDTVR